MSKCRNNKLIEYNIYLAREIYHFRTKHKQIHQTYIFNTS